MAKPMTMPTLPPQPPVRARHIESSLLFSLDDDPARPTDYLISLALDAAEHARTVSLAHLSERITDGPRYPDIWPGEHYRFLTGLVLSLQPKQIVEIGTGGGLSALSMLAGMPQDARLISFDLKPWQTDTATYLEAHDFADGRLVQVVDDLTETLLIPRYLEILQNAEVVFIDAAKDGQTEAKLLENLETVRFNKKTVFVFDDIRLWNMLKFWREIRRPKLDVTSFGHWSGTGLVEWSS